MNAALPEKKTPASVSASGLWIIEQGLCYCSLFFLTMIPAAEVVARLVFKTGVPNSSWLMEQMLLAIGLFSGMITTKKSEHLSISLIQILPEKVKNWCAIGTHVLSAFILTIVALSTPSFIRIGLSGRIIGLVSDRVYALALPLGYGVMAFRFVRQAAALLRRKFTGAVVWAIPLLASLLGAWMSLPALGKFIWDFDIPDAVYKVIDFQYALVYYAKVPAVVILFVAAFSGAPLFVVIGGLALLLLQASGGEIDVVVNQIYTALTQNSIIAIPLFTVTGFLLSESRAGERLVLAFRSLFSWLPGGMIIATVVICAFFTSFTGASGVTILALGGILYSILSEHSKYSNRFSIGLLTSVGSIGLLFPPSLPINLVGATMQTDIRLLFAGGVVPGLILVAAVAIFGIIASVRTKIPVERFSLKKSALAVRGSLFEILLPVILIAGYFSGVFSLVEISAIAVIYVFIVEVIVHREIKIRELPAVLLKAIPITGGVLSILAMSQALSYYIVDTQAPENFARWMQTAINSRFVFLLLLNLALLVVGCLMDIFSAILIVLPLVVPLGLAYGIDPVHLGIIFIVNLEVGFLTPPVGLNLFLAAYRFKKPFTEICRNVFPFLLIQLAVVLLVTYIPALSTYLRVIFQ
ncbi:MAG: TRAP transporter large permease subunit [Treponema sp.]|jgi:tripartite ATP-independent transporter DctM subunit|nr:TRAP transporter large permease subunit [Treponema sp.]